MSTRQSLGLQHQVLGKNLLDRDPSRILGINCRSSGHLRPLRRWKRLEEFINSARAIINMALQWFVQLCHHKSSLWIFTYYFLSRFQGCVINWTRFGFLSLCVCAAAGSSLSERDQTESPVPSKRPPSGSGASESSLSTKRPRTSEKSAGEQVRMMNVSAI